jgi:hypothetical protein
LVETKGVKRAAVLDEEVVHLLMGEKGKDGDYLKTNHTLYIVLLYTIALSSISH